MPKRKKALQLASVASMIDQFNIPNIEILQSLGYTVDVVADFTHPGTISSERSKDLMKRLSNMDVRVFDIAIPRTLNPKAIVSAYKQVRKLLDRENYDLMHCHSPIGGVIARQAAKKTKSKGLKVIYTAHGFHFYDGAPLKNWLIFYPIEKHYSRYTDVLITINKEDYRRASEKFNAKKVIYIPGVGVDTAKFAPRKSGRDSIRKELNVENSRILLLSVDRQNEHENYESVIRAVSGIYNLTYVIVGANNKTNELAKIATECEVDLRILRERTDVSDFYDAADVYVSPSTYEGLNINLLEAMASSLPCLVGGDCNDHGLIDDEGGYLFNSSSIDGIRKTVIDLLSLSTEERRKRGNHNRHKILSVDLQSLDAAISEKLKRYEHVAEVLNRQLKRKEINVPIDCKLLISVGELSNRKNHKVVVEAFQQLSEDYWYVIVGRGDLKEELKALDHTGRFKMLGYRSDIVELLKCSDAFLFPSIQEGLPVALMEAMSTGLPCIVSNIRGNIDLIDNKDLLFDAESSEGSLKAIRKLMTSDCVEDIGVQNLEKMSRFDISKIREDMISVYSMRE